MKTVFNKNKLTNMFQALTEPDFTGLTPFNPIPGMPLFTAHQTTAGCFTKEQKINSKNSSAPQFLEQMELECSSFMGQLFFE